MRRASSRAGFRVPSTSGTHSSRRRASCCWAMTSPAWASASIPSLNSVTTAGATIAPSPNRGPGRSVVTGKCRNPRSRPRAASAPPPEMVTSCAPASAAPRATPTVSSVSPEQETANTSDRGPMNPGVRYCFTHDDGDGDGRGADRDHDVADDSRAAHAAEDDVVDVRRRGQVDAADHVRRRLVRGGELLRRASQRVDHPERVRHEGAPARLRPRTSGRCPRPRPSPSTGRAPRRRPPRPRRRA